MSLFPRRTVSQCAGINRRLNLVTTGFLAITVLWALVVVIISAADACEGSREIAKGTARRIPTRNGFVFMSLSINYVEGFCTAFMNIV
jgi:hypothetical protein